MDGEDKKMRMLLGPAEEKIITMTLALEKAHTTMEGLIDRLGVIFLFFWQILL